MEASDVTIGVTLNATQAFSELERLQQGLNNLSGINIGGRANMASNVANNVNVTRPRPQTTQLNENINRSLTELNIQLKINTALLTTLSTSISRLSQTLSRIRFGTGSDGNNRSRARQQTQERPSQIANASEIANSIERTEVATSRLSVTLSRVGEVGRRSFSIIRTSVGVLARSLINLPSTIINLERSLTRVAVGIRTSFVGRGIASYVSRLAQVTREYGNLRAAIGLTNTSEQDIADTQERLINLSVRLGRPVRELASGYEFLSSALAGTIVQGSELNRLFENLTLSISALNLSSQGGRNVFNAAERLLGVGQFNRLSIRQIEGQIPLFRQGVTQAASNFTGSNITELTQLTRLNRTLTPDNIRQIILDAFENIRENAERVVSFETLDRATQRLGNSFDLFIRQIDQSAGLMVFWQNSLNTLSRSITRARFAEATRSGVDTTTSTFQRGVFASGTLALNRAILNQGDDFSRLADTSSVVSNAEAVERALDLLASSFGRLAGTLSRFFLDYIVPIGNAIISNLPTVINVLNQSLFQPLLNGLRDFRVFGVNVFDVLINKFQELSNAVPELAPLTMQLDEIATVSPTTQQPANPNLQVGGFTSALRDSLLFEPPVPQLESDITFEDFSGDIEEFARDIEVAVENGMTTIQQASTVNRRSLEAFFDTLERQTLIGLSDVNRALLRQNIQQNVPIEDPQDVTEPERLQVIETARTFSIDYQINLDRVRDAVAIFDNLDERVRMLTETYTSGESTLVSYTGSKNNLLATIARGIVAIDGNIMSLRMLDNQTDQVMMTIDQQVVQLNKLIDLYEQADNALTLTGSQRRAAAIATIGNELFTAAEKGGQGFTTGLINALDRDRNDIIDSFGDAVLEGVRSIRNQLIRSIATSIGQAIREGGAASNVTNTPNQQSIQQALQIIAQAGGQVGMNQQTGQSGTNNFFNFLINSLTNLAP